MFSSEKVQGTGLVNTSLSGNGQMSKATHSTAQDHGVPCE